VRSKPLVRESEVERYFIQQVFLAGWDQRKIKFIMRNGAPDRLVMKKPGRMCLCELKRPKGGRVAGRQSREHIALRAFGIEVFVIYTFEDVDVFIRSWK
jgi:hypothetical protein